MRRIIPILVLASLAAGCSLSLGDLDEVVGSGDEAIERREVTGFDAVRLEGVGSVDVTEGDGFAVEVIADDNLVGRITTDVEAGTLVVGVERGFTIVPRAGITVRVVLPELTRLELSGAGDVDVGPIEAESLDIDVSGAGSVTVDELVADELTVALSGVGGVVVAGGEVADQSVSLSGVGDYSAVDLASATADVANSGVGSIEVWATERLSADISGTGDIRYRGSPTTEVSISGLGSFESIDG